MTGLPLEGVGASGMGAATATTPGEASRTSSPSPTSRCDPTPCVWDTRRSGVSGVVDPLESSCAEADRATCPVRYRRLETATAENVYRVLELVIGPPIRWCVSRGPRRQ